MGEKMGFAVWVEDEAGPYQTVPYPGESWQPEGHPVRQPHEYIRNGTAKMLTFFHPTTGEVRVKGVTQSTNAILHPWVKEQVNEVLKTLPRRRFWMKKRTVRCGQPGRQVYRSALPWQKSFHLYACC